MDIPLEIAEPTTGMAQAILTELAQHLPALALSGSVHVIDLTSLPMNDSDKRELEAILGRGEVSVTLQTIGDSEIFETRYSGIWWTKHFTADNQLISELLEITTVPEIIKSHPDDIKQSADELKNLIDSDESGEKA